MAKQSINSTSTNVFYLSSVIAAMSLLFAFIAEVIVFMMPSIYACLYYFNLFVLDIALLLQAFSLTGMIFLSVMLIFSVILSGFIVMNFKGHIYETFIQPAIIIMFLLICTTSGIILISPLTFIILLESFVYIDMAISAAQQVAFIVFYPSAFLALISFIWSGLEQEEQNNTSTNVGSRSLYEDNSANINIHNHWHHNTKNPEDKRTDGNKKEKSTDSTYENTKQKYVDKVTPASNSSSAKTQQEKSTDSTYENTKQKYVAKVQR